MAGGLLLYSLIEKEMGEDDEVDPAWGVFGGAVWTLLAGASVGQRRHVDGGTGGAGRAGDGDAGSVCRAVCRLFRGGWRSGSSGGMWGTGTCKGTVIFE